MKAIEGDRHFTINYNFRVNHVWSILSFILLVVILSCSSSEEDPAPVPNNNPPPTVCRVKSVTSNATGRYDATTNYTLNYTLTYSYDESGNMTNSTASYNYSFSDGKTSTSSSSTNNQFDSEGFLIRSIGSYNSTDKDGKVSNHTRNSDYEYKDGRLIKEINKTVDDGKPKDYSFGYEYDTEGRLIKFVNGYHNSYTKFEWNGNKLQKLTNVDAYGNSESPFLEYNQDGLLVKSIETYGGGTDESRYTYDSDGNMTRSERYINTKPASATSYEFDGKENPFKASYENLKGHPTVPRAQPEYAPKQNLTKLSHYNATTAGQWELSSYSVYTHDYNARNLPVEIVTKNMDKDGKETSTQRESYEFQDCQ